MTADDSLTDTALSDRYHSCRNQQPHGDRGPQASSSLHPCRRRYRRLRRARTMYDVATAIRGGRSIRVPRVINLSLGARLFDYPLTLMDAVAYAQEQERLGHRRCRQRRETRGRFLPPACLRVSWRSARPTTECPGPRFSPTTCESYEGVFMLPPRNPPTVPQGYGNPSGTSQALCVCIGHCGASPKFGLSGIQTVTGCPGPQEGEVGSVLEREGGNPGRSSHDHTPGDLTF